MLAVDAFSEEKIAANVLKQILKRKDVVLDIKMKDAPKESLILYEKGKIVDYFMMVVQGHVDVTVGMEEFTFPQGDVFLIFYLEYIRRLKSGKSSTHHLNDTIRFDVSSGGPLSHCC